MSKNTTIVILVISLGMTSMGSLIDSDQVNTSLVQFLFEFLFLVIVCFGLNTVLYLICKFLIRQIKWLQGRATS